MSTDSQPTPRPWPVTPLLLGVASVVILVLVVSTRFLGGEGPDLDVDLEGRVAILPVVNATGDPGDDWVVYGLAEMMTSALSRTRGVRVLDSKKLFATISERGLDVTEAAARDRLRHLARAAGAGLVVDTSLRKRGAGVGRKARYTAELRFFGAGGETVSGSLEGSDVLEAADLVVRSISRSLAGGQVPVKITDAFSRDPFVDRLFGMGLQELHSAGAVEARPYFEIALKSRPSFLWAKAELAECARQTAEAERSRDLALEVLEEAQVLGERHLQAWGFRALARLATDEGRFEEAQEHTSQAFSLQLEAEDPVVRGDLLFDLARLALARGERGRAEELFVEVLQIRQETSDRLGEAATLVEIGSLFLVNGDLDGARGVLNQARQIAATLDDVWIEMRVVTHLGDVARRQGELVRAGELWRQALSFYQVQGDTARQLLISRDLADILVADEEYESAEDLLHDVIRLAVEQERPELEAEASLRLTWVLLKSGYPLQARIFLDRTLALDRWLDDERHYLQVVIGWFAYEQGNYRLAVDTLRQAKRQAADEWPAWSQEYLGVFEEALVVGERLALPGEAGYFAPSDPVTSG